MGRIAEILQRHIDETPYGVSQRKVADRIGVAPTTVGNWLKGDLKELPTMENLEAIARLTNTEYSVVLEAALIDTGYKSANQRTRRKAGKTQ